MTRLLLKSILDRSLALAALCVASPLLLGTAVAIAFEGEGPVLFTQLRPGRFGRPFRIYKLRTMLPLHAPDGRVRSESERLTRLGIFLRKTSIDELPQLWNVLRGELSLVGPRPLLMQYLPRYSKEQARRHLVLPGITGLAQVSGRNGISWDEKLGYDVEYVDNWSLSLDLRILLRTVRAVFTARGLRAPGEPGTEEFMGTASNSPPPAPAQRREAQERKARSS